MSIQHRPGFWQEALAIQGSITLHVMPPVLVLGMVAGLSCGIAYVGERILQTKLSLEVAPYEFAGVVLGLLLVLRTNAGYDRWWEARKLWGGIVNQCRNLVISALSYGPSDAKWRDEVVRWTALFPHVARLSLRGEKPAGQVVNLVGKESTEQLAAADHMPSFVALKLGTLLHEAYQRMDMNQLAFIQVDRERATLIDHIGACERILKTPLPRVYSIKIRRFILLFLLLLPWALMHRMDSDWAVPVITMLVAYPLLSLDRIGIELQNPFVITSLSHLPLDDISMTIERNVFGVLKVKQANQATSP